MSSVLQFQTQHKHPTLGDLDILIIVDAHGALRLQSIKFVQKTITDSELVARRDYTVYFSGRVKPRQATFVQWKDAWNGTHGAGEVSDEPFLDDLNAFANSAALRGIMRRKVDAGLRALQVARHELSVEVKT